ncbi:hypothetical protein LCGC14_1069140 [marine sediment metagenome]|uniref:VWFA domain-containing protein n=1 Tax=marine sediment metagenome TaxID=412755 RepID=A0A0F9Q1V9_9ZZZZ
MGYTAYSAIDRGVRAVSLGYDTKSAPEIFTQKSINNAMSPHGVKMRESRDSEEHPKSLAIVLALDVTGSMGSIPHFLVKEGLPDIMDRIIKQGEPDPQVLFLGIGDHECDTSPLQVGQFESGDELLDKWLTDIYLEGGGGGNAGESYMLAWYFAAYHTATDCFEKRKKKGYLFTIGDEPVLPEVPGRFLKTLMGDGQYENFSAASLCGKASEKYNVFHIHIHETASGSRQEVIDGWKQILADNLIVADHKEDVAKIISDTVIGNRSQVEGDIVHTEHRVADPVETEEML